jgi:quercetin 2,3-dioxygenase
MITIRPAGERGKTALDWLDSRHTFSFADYYDDEHTHFGPLRVINEDIVAPGKGFGTHPHANMEIITYVVAGALEHRDSLGTGEVIHAGEVQRMSAGDGITHSEFNHSKTDPVHLLQIWILPERRGIPTGYEQKKLTLSPNQWQVVADPTGSGALSVHQDVSLLAARIEKGKKLSYATERGSAWLQVVKGSITIGDITANAGDGLAIVNEKGFDVLASADSEILLFDLRKAA